MIECRKKVLAIVGPTASGKTKLSIELAKILNGEVVSADSMQVYTKMNIGTAKPTQSEMSGIRHHMIDFLDPKLKFSVAEYVSLAKKSIEDIISRNRLPIICGGTGLYIDSLLQNVKFDDGENDYELREVLIDKGQKLGGQVLLNELSEFDPEMAESLHPNNIKRIARAIEFYRTTGITMSERISKSKLEASDYNAVMIGLCYKDREILYDKINSRVDKMILDGLEKEAREILDYGLELTALGAIGYKEMFSYINGECDFESTVEKIKRSTRRYAKRQLTWFRRNKSINWIFVDNYAKFEDILKTAEKIFINGGT